jgi:hypothetical protein
VLRKDDLLRRMFMPSQCKVLAGLGIVMPIYNGVLNYLYWTLSLLL